MSELQIPALEDPAAARPEGIHPEDNRMAEIAMMRGTRHRTVAYAGLAEG